MDCEVESDMLGGFSQSSSRTPRNRSAPNQAPQDTVKQFWNQFNTKYPGKVLTILPDNSYARSKASQQPNDAIQSSAAVKSYEQATRECELAVARIVKECERINQKYTDPHFDIEFDLKTGKRNCLDGLGEENVDLRPRGDIFEHPQFYINGPTAGDVRQGRDGDCWLMAALCTMGNKEGLIDRICVARNEKVGVYGFVFYRDGEWQQCIIDDKLYLRAADYDESIDERLVWDDINRKNTEEEYRKVWQTGSRALYFAQCSDENETWLPLLEKAYAKAHGEYSAIEGGFVGEAIEDLTGGVTSEILSTNILDKDQFWEEELMNVNKQFLFGCATGIFSNWLDPKYKGPPRDRRGISEGHSYSIMDAREANGVRLLRLRNPWGKKEWSGAWSDGAEEWTPEWMNLLGHKFGNDGVFWISYDDLLKKYQHFDRTRLFGPEWTVTQQWTSLNVPWSADYQKEKFVIDLSRSSPVVIILSQLDTRYFRGLEGEYDFTLQFRLEKEGEDDYIVRSSTNYMMSRAVNTDITLDAGKYSVLVKVTAYRRKNADVPEDVKLREQTIEKLKQQHIREKKMQARRERMAERERLRQAAETAKKACSHGELHEPIAVSNGINEHDDCGKQTNGFYHEKMIDHNISTTNGAISNRQVSDGPSLKTSFTKIPNSDEAIAEMLEDFEFDSDLDMPPENPDSPPFSLQLQLRLLSLSFRRLPVQATDKGETITTPGTQYPLLKLQVVKPGCCGERGEAPLDRDDPAVSATFEKRTSWL
ncbi:hypothetical protein UA08_03481 [Talaromyces atroroseus]|uniref:Calpain catalytic domain-containing protein n=1 Tax=Talaromyces atroroseus TaxID=1441469 RepID=A0A225B1X9_TALAT|nr:hypothetical protein UA08_03481 [Talaromyces atroroseus]OKL61226.1 hypothetical protein UA08_03481 [Talaromyces atroroseus]